MDELDPATLPTLSDEAIARTLRMNVAEFADVAATIAANPNSTIEPAQRASADAMGRRALHELGAARPEHGIASGLDIEQTIGEGGMGIVRLATQRSLGRKVAVKTLRPAARTDASTLRLLREAWVTGTLEHPNIVPVYDLGLDVDGSPIIVLKRIEGVEWADIMRDANAARARFGADDLLEYNLRILVQLCNAVSLAHARGVLHRDLKPENVMIGSFGETYLVDWGIAVSLKADALGRLPLAADQNEMAGTPCYMAPEMLGALGKLSVQTDVYLLGAILHEILTGAPPHTGSFRQIVGSILLSTFTYAPDVPRELAEIARRAMAREPAGRFASAEELRLRLEWYLRHRGSLAISAEALRRLADMRTLVAEAKAHESPQEQLYHLFAECRFGFRQALNASADNAAARSGLREAIEIVVRFEVARGAAEAAAGALAELDDAPPELVASVEKALRAQKQKLERLEKLDASLDPGIGRRTRALVTGVLGMVWTAAPLVISAVDRTYPDAPYWWIYLITGVISAIASLVVLWGRQSLTKTTVNRRLVAAGAITFAAQLALQLGCHMLGISKVAVTVLHLFEWWLVVSFLALMIDRRFWVPASGFLAAFIAACAIPAQRWNLMSGANLVLLVTFLVAWWQPIEDRPRFIRLPVTGARDAQKRRVDPD